MSDTRKWFTCTINSVNIDNAGRFGIHATDQGGAFKNYYIHPADGVSSAGQASLLQGVLAIGVGNKGQLLLADYKSGNKEGHLDQVAM